MACRSAGGGCHDSGASEDPPSPRSLPQNHAPHRAATTAMAHTRSTAVAVTAATARGVTAAVLSLSLAMPLRKPAPVLGVAVGVGVGVGAEEAELDPALDGDRDGVAVAVGDTDAVRDDEGVCVGVCEGDAPEASAEVEREGVCVGVDVLDANALAAAGGVADDEEDATATMTGNVACAACKKFAVTATAAAVTGEDSEAGAVHVMDKDVELIFLDCVMPPAHELIARFWVAALMLPTVVGHASTAVHES